MSNKMCDAKQRVVVVTALTTKLEKRCGVEVDYLGRYHTSMRPIPRIRLKCPVCGRRMLSSIFIDHDGCDIFHVLPPHKVKGWWKKKKKLRREKLQSRQV